jgi:hypothetical protein
MYNIHKSLTLTPEINKDKKYTDAEITIDFTRSIILSFMDESI